LLTRYPGIRLCKLSKIFDFACDYVLYGVHWIASSLVTPVATPDEPTHVNVYRGVTIDSFKNIMQTYTLNEPRRRCINNRFAKAIDAQSWNVYP
jgi:hypothetical protein